MRSRRRSEEELEDLFAVAFQREVNVRMRQSEAFEHSVAVGAFDGSGYEELAPGEGDEDQFSGFDGGADRIKGAGPSAENEVIS